MVYDIASPDLSIRLLAMAECFDANKVPPMSSPGDRIKEAEHHANWTAHWKQCASDCRAAAQRVRVEAEAQA